MKVTYQTIRHEPVSVSDGWLLACAVLLQSFLILLMSQCRLAAEDGGAKQVYGGIDQDTRFHARSDSGAFQMFASVKHSILTRLSILMS